MLVKEALNQCISQLCLCLAMFLIIGINTNNGSWGFDSFEDFEIEDSDSEKYNIKEFQCIL